MTKRIDRRTFVREAALGAGALMFGPASSLMPRSARAATLDGAFRQGVASGEPGPRAITLAGSQAKWKLIANQVMITSLDAPPHNPINTDSWDGYGAERAELIDFIGARGITDVSFITGDIHTYFTGEVTRTGRRGPTDGLVRATEFVCSAITSPGIVDRVADTEPERVAAATPTDAAVRANNPQIVFSNQAYKGYGIVEARPDQLRVTYRAVRETRRQPSEAFTLRSFHVDAGEPAVIDDGGA